MEGKPRAEEEAEGLIQCWGGGRCQLRTEALRGEGSQNPAWRPWVTGSPPDYLLIMTPAGRGGKLRQKSWSSPELSHRGRRGSRLPPLQPGSCHCYLDYLFLQHVASCPFQTLPITLPPAPSPEPAHWPPKSHFLLHPLYASLLAPPTFCISVPRL